MKPIQILRRFVRASGGAAALEFALIAPFIMVPLMLGSVDLLDLLQANRRAQNAAASIADVVSRDTAISDSEVGGLWDAVGVLMYPSGTLNMKTRVTSVRVISATSAEVLWSEGHNIAPRDPDSAVDLAAGMMQPGTSVIMTETEYPYTSPLGFVASQVTLKHTAYRRSRLVDPIPRVAIEPS